MEANQVKEVMEAYTSIYNQNEEPQEVLSEEMIDEDLAGTVDSALKKTGEVLRKVPGVSAALTPAGKGRKTATKTSGGYRPVKEETDLFDYILEYLVAEGYADTNENALVIMANMSEEWRQSIVESDSIEAMKARAAKRRQQRYGKNGGGGRDDFRPYTEDDYNNSNPGYGSGASSQAKDA
jgi:hypothetical protein